MNNISKEDYLSIIYKFRDENNKIKATRIAQKLGVSNAAVSDMLKKLSRDGQITYERYKEISLSTKGEQYARNMIRRHRIWEVFLHQVVGLPWEKVHDEANNLEHSASDELINKMEEMLNFPEYDPHGDPIPTKDGYLPEIKNSVPLSKLNKKQSGIVIRVNDFDNSFLKYISKIGIELGKTIKVLDVLSFDKSLLVKIDRKEFNISNKLASNVFVEIFK